VAAVEYTPTGVINAPIAVFLKMATAPAPLGAAKKTPEFAEPDFCSMELESITTLELANTPCPATPLLYTMRALEEVATSFEL
jgi:hypothetical protein